MFSKRGAFELTPNVLARAVAQRPPTWDLTVSNPTRVGFEFDDEGLGELMRGVDVTRYEPHSRGMTSARVALGEELDWNPEHLLLTATTSEAYSLLIKLFCDPGDRVLIPEPSYPLLSMLARLEGTVAIPYACRYDGDWHIDRAALLESLSPKVKLVLAVSPNNPTGAYLSSADLDFLLSHDLPLVLDEVFGPYDLRQTGVMPLRHSKAGSGLLFSLGGLSKAAALPQLKLSWMAVSGEERRVERALAQLDVLTDTYLSANEPSQRALGSLLGPAAKRRAAIFERLKHNRRRVRALEDEVPELTALPVQGGWYQVIRLPLLASEERWTLELLDRGVLVQPGWFYDFPEEAWAVLSLLTPPEAFSQGLSQLGKLVSQKVSATGAH